MNKKGFTLVELIAVLVILSVVITIVITVVGPIISGSKDDLLVSQKHSVEEAAKAYYLKEGNLDLTDSCVSISKLIRKGYIEASEVLNPKDNEPMHGSVHITYSSNQYKYEYQDSECAVCQYTGLSEIECDNEKFYVIDDDGEDITALAKDPLNFNEFPAKQGTARAPMIPHPYNTARYTQAEIDEFNNAINSALDSYETYLKDGIGVESAEIRMPVVNDVYAVGCNSSDNTCRNAPDWVRSFPYWFGTPGTWFETSGDYGYGTVSNANSASEFFVRPVLVVNSSEVVGLKNIGTLVSDSDGNGKISVGDKYSIKVNSTQTFNFYVLSIEGGQVNLILEKNICADGTLITFSNKCRFEWITKTDYTAAGGQADQFVGASYSLTVLGPITASKYVTMATSSWDNINSLNIYLSVMCKECKIGSEIKSFGNYRQKRIDIVIQKDKTIYLVKVLSDLNKYRFYMDSYNEQIEAYNTTFKDCHFVAIQLVKQKEFLIANKKNLNVVTITDLIKTLGE